MTNPATFTPGDWTLNGNQLIALHTDQDGDHEGLIAELYEDDWAPANTHRSSRHAGFAHLALDYLDGRGYERACALLPKSRAHESSSPHRAAIRRGLSFCA
jgi:hypothetical protein